jgi:glycosyltransferase involved in cell wall biosynthesis
MRVWFHAPMKPPTHPVPSGDRRMARLLMRALTRSGCAVSLASRLRTYDGVGDPVRQQIVAGRADRIVARLIARARCDGAPDAWLTYHLYHKAPDLLGPAVADALGVPYVVAEASRAPKRAHGPWAEPYERCERALARADAVLSLNPADDACVVPVLRPGVPIVALKPFLDPRPFSKARRRRSAVRADLAARFGLDPGAPWLCAAAMMRPGDKARSYAALAEAAAGLDAPLLIAGDGPERAAVERAFSVRAAPTVFLGALNEAALADLFAASDVLVWPALNEAYGMALLEAQAAGCPVVAGASGGVAGVVADGETGLLTPEGDAAALARAAADLLADAACRTRMAEAAVRRVTADHTLTAAAATLRSVLERVGAS